MNKEDTATLIIHGELTDLNSYIRAERTNRYKAAKIKEKETNRVWIEAKAQGIKKQDKPIGIIIKWYTKNKKKDKDNIAFAKKFILDGLIAAGVIEDDGYEDIAFFVDLFEVDKTNPRIEVILTRIKKDLKYPLTK